MISHEKELEEFLQHFEIVFDADWEYTKCTLQSGLEGMIAEEGTFLNPKVQDEDNNWCNRGSLLDSYRRLVAVLKEAGWVWGSTQNLLPPGPTRSLQICPWCEEALANGETKFVALRNDGTSELYMTTWHFECFLTACVGTVAHQQKRCTCFGGSEDNPELSRREQAEAATAWFYKMNPLHMPTSGKKCPGAPDRKAKNLLPDPEPIRFAPPWRVRTLKHGGAQIIAADDKVVCTLGVESAGLAPVLAATIEICTWLQVVFDKANEALGRPEAKIDQHVLNKPVKILLTAPEALHMQYLLARASGLVSTKSEFMTYVAKFKVLDARQAGN